MLFYRENHNQAICIQMIDSLNVPVLSTFNYFRPMFRHFQKPNNFRNLIKFKPGLLTTFLT